ncbi:SigE family RNA polymerase sigma factor [Ornithinicoccus hortensis]|uniref:RNA polymerase sigma-70 factor (Sigma-E family) n=1 Tax=Ornithinicoccus hortensis TaxID=82346 RepID=A0A542YMG1_9MICO|nr:SigE family RNA polymerase sigma factor [Ornithinicoccus hortensis]TQL49276.1 RNA polymerase sigma-70 factor (sigma-E family) [Ornithinicoccus hortensis]
MRKRERDEEFSAFVHAATPELLRVAWFLTGDVEDAKELVQAALTKTYAVWSRVRPGQAMPYTRTVLVNHRNDTWRKHRREVLVDPHAPSGDGGGRGVGPAPVADDVAVQQDLIQALAALPEQQRRVVVLRHYCDLSEATVAHELGISTGTVKSTAARGLANLRKYYAHFEETVR